MTQNHLGQPVGLPLDGWQRPLAPGKETLVGRRCVLEPLDADRHGQALFDAFSLDRDGRMWTYLSYGPFTSRGAYEDWSRRESEAEDPLFYAIVDTASGAARGVAAYLRITPAFGTIEVGHLAFSTLLQRTAAATEAMFLMMRHAFALGYRRYEWKCDALNAPSRDAALRLGFTFEGILRQVSIMKGRNRDTAWYSILDKEWPAIERALVRWLDDGNFDSQGKQRLGLAATREKLGD